MTILQTFDIRPQSKQRTTVIWMHGLGANGHDFASIVPELGLPEGHGIGFIFPHAPVQAVTINGGMKMRSWYDIVDISFNGIVDNKGIDQSALAIDELIQKEVQQGIPTEHILLAGFSQGGAIALHIGLSYAHKLAGVLALSTYFPTLESMRPNLSPKNQSMPIFMAHGTMDAVVDIRMAKQAYTHLKALQYPISWQQYPMQHTVCHQEIKAISVFIKSLLIKERPLHNP